MFPPSGGGGNNPQSKQVTTLFNRNRPGGLAQGGAQGSAGGQGMTPPAAGSVGEHLAEAFKGITAQEPGAMESLRAFLLALQELGGQSSQQPPATEPGAMEQRPTGFPGIAPAAAQSAPSGRAPLG